MTTDPLGIITDVNKQMEALTGCTRDELIGAPFKSYFTDHERAEAGIKLVLSERKVTNYELTARARDGKVECFEVTENDHRDHILSEDERASNKMMQICVSRAKTPRLVLDL